METALKLETPTPLDRYFKYWVLFIPITSYLVFSNIQGTLPSYLMAFFSILVVTFSKQYKLQLKRYYFDLVLFLYVFILLSLIAQLVNSIFDLPSFTKVTLIDNSDIHTSVFRNSFFTQSAYLFTGILTFIFVKNYYQNHWDRYIFIAIGFFAIYGLFEFIYFLLFHDFGDFLTNRVFDDHDTINFGNQLMHIGSFTFQRINSLALEPSMFAFTVLPFWIYSSFTNHKKLSILLFITLCLSTSTTALIGIVFYFLNYIKRSNKLVLLLFILFSILMILLNLNLIQEILDKVLFQKINAQTESGIMRSFFFKNHIDYFLDLNFLNMLFGIGFGYVRSTDFFSTLLVNNGVIGFLLFTWLFLYPIIKLNNTKSNVGLKMSLASIYITMMVSVPEFSFLSIWLFLGISYNQIREEKRNLV